MDCGRVEGDGVDGVRVCRRYRVWEEMFLGGGGGRRSSEREVKPGRYITSWVIRKIKGDGVTMKQRSPKLNKLMSLMRHELGQQSETHP